jgi:alpha/beta superfamily hydrolase
MNLGVINKIFLCGAILTNVAAQAQSTPAHAEGLYEEVISVTLDGGKNQQGVLSIKKGTQNHTRLAVLLPGYPSVVRPVVLDGTMQSSRIAGNFLIRARRHLVDDAIATLLVDCYSDSGDICSGSYQASAARQQDVQKLIDTVRERLTSIQQVWLVGTSMGTISSSFMPLYSPSKYAGAIHTAAITEPNAPRSYRELDEFDYRRSGVPQFFVHHRNDPCSLTTYAGAKQITERQGIPLISVSGGEGFRGDACGAMTEHGFRGMERATMLAIGSLIRTGVVEQFEIR